MTRILLLISGICVASICSAQQLIPSFSIKKQQTFLLSNQSQDKLIQICDLEVGTSYDLILDASTDGPRLIDPDQISSRNLQFVAAGPCRDIRISWPEYPYYHSVKLTIRPIEPEAKPNWIEEKMMGIQTSSNNNAAYLIEDIFIGGDCFDVGGVTFTGVSGQIGTFSNGMSSIGIDEGIVIATGPIWIAEGPNNSTSAGGGGLGQVNDPDFSVIANGTDIYDRASIEFDFTPTVSQVSFEYVFASEEYCDYVNSTFNDKFGFFISGPGINGQFSNNGENIAVVPGSGEPVEINTVNYLSNPGFYVDNNPPGQDDNCSTGQAAAVSDIQYDGFTTVLTAVANVIPCQTYRIRLKVADLGDGAWDSAVFLKANSFNAGTTASIDAMATGNTVSATGAYEGCGNGTITFTRNGNDLSEDFPITFTYGSSTTATPGVDFEPIPTTIIIPAGQQSVTISFNVFPDDIFEGVEFVSIEIENACSCSTNEVLFEIHDPPPLEALGNEEYICANAPYTLTPFVNGGVPGYTYQWSDGSTGPNLTIEESEPTFYTVTISDDCGQTTEAYFGIFPQAPEAELAGDLNLCPDNPTGILEINTDGFGPFDVTYTVNGTPFTEYGLFGPPIEINVYIPGVYQLVSVVANGCPANVSGSATVEVIDVLAGLDAIDPSCQGAADGSLAVNINSGDGPYSYDWAGTLPDTNYLDNQGPGDYALTVTDANGCTTELTATLTDPPLLTADLSQVTDIDCSQPNGVLAVTASGGTGSLSYLWNDGNTDAFRDDLAPGDYSVTVTDSLACSTIIDTTITADLATPDLAAEPLDVLTCDQTSVLLSVSSLADNANYQWYDPNGQPIPGIDTSYQTTEPGTYIVVATNPINSCTDSLELVIDQQTDPPVVDIASPDTLTCSLTDLVLDASNSDDADNFMIDWSTTDGNFVTGTGSLSPTIDAPGTYQLQITNTTTGCVAQTSIVVDANTDSPDLSLDDSPLINCYDPDGWLSLSGDTNPDYDYVWTSPDGDIISLPDSTAIQVASAGQYNVVITDPDNDCSTNLDINVMDDLDPPVADAGLPVELDCIDQMASIDASGSSSNGNYSYLWTSSDGSIVAGADGLSPEVGQAAWYTLLVTNLDNGCTALDSVEVLENSQAPSVVLLTPDTINCNQPTINIDASNSDWANDFVTNWTLNDQDISQDGLVISVDQPGTYNLFITNPNTGCTGLNTVEVPLDTIHPMLNLADPEVLTCYQPSTDLLATAGAQGDPFSSQWQAINGSLSTSQGLMAATQEAGTYEIIITNDLNGCQTVGQFEVLADQDNPNIEAGEEALLNCAQTDHSLSASIDQTGDILSYWVGPLGDTLSNDASQILTISDDGLYQLYAFDQGNGCASVDEVLISENFTPSTAIITDPDVLTCEQTSLSLSASSSSQGPDYSYQWQTLDGNILSGSDGLNPSINATGSYQLTVIHEISQCSDVAEVTVGIDTISPVVQIDPANQLDCNITSVSLAANVQVNGNAFDIDWSTQDGNILSGDLGLNPVVDAAGEYVLIITDTDNGCTNQASVMVMVDPNIPEAIAGPDRIITCDVPVVDLDGSQSTAGSNISYVWTGLDQTPISTTNPNQVMADQPGSYVLMVTNGDNGCIRYDTVEVGIDTISPQALIAEADILTCSQTSFSLDGTGSSQGTIYSYAWTGPTDGIQSGQTSLMPVISQPGLYNLVVENNDNGCQSETNITVGSNTLEPTIDLNTPDILTCGITSIELISTATGNGPFSYQWSTSVGVLDSDADLANVMVSGAGAYDVLVTDQDNGCTQTASITVLIDTVAPQILLADIPELTCDEPNQSLSATVNGEGPFTYAWSGPNGQIASGEDSPNPLITGPGIYSITVTDLHNACVNTGSQEVNQDVSVPNVTINPPDQLTCAQSTVILSVNVSNGGSPSFQWWDNNGDPIANSDDASISVEEPGDYQMLLTNTENGCEVERQFTVEQDIEPPLADAGPMDTLHCNQTIVSLNGSASDQGSNYSYQWTGAGINQGGQGLYPNINQPGIFLLEVTNLDNGCSSFDETQVIELLPQNLELMVQQPPCFGEQANISILGTSGGLPPYEYDISGSFVVNNNNNFSISQEGSYIITASDQNGCTVSQTVEIVMPELFTIGIVPEVAIDFGDSVQIEVALNVPPSDVGTVQWSPADGLSCTDCLEPFAAPDQSQRYEVQVQTVDGCLAEAEIYFRVDRRPNIYIPSAFSPNGDNTNDVFVVYASNKQVKQINSLQIYNRWGESVFEIYGIPPNDPVYGWDGTFRGQPMNPAVFVYWTEVEMIDGTTVLLKGDVTLAK